MPNDTIYISETRICPVAICPTSPDGQKYLAHVLFRPANSLSPQDWFQWRVRKDPSTGEIVERLRKPALDAVTKEPTYPWNDRNGNIYRDHCLYCGNDQDGYYRHKDRIVAVRGIMLDFDSHSSSDMPLLKIANILESEPFLSAVPCSRIVMSGNGYQIHINSPCDITGDDAERKEQIRRYEQNIQSVMLYCVDVWKLRPDEKCKDINRLHRHFPSFNTKKLTSVTDAANRTPVREIINRQINAADVSVFIESLCKSHPVSVPVSRPIRIFKNDSGAAPTLEKLLEPPCIKALWEAGSGEGNRNSDRFALLCRLHICRFSENDAARYIDEFNGRCTPPDDAATVNAHVRNFYGNPKPCGCGYMRDTVHTCPYIDKTLEVAKRECPFTKTRKEQPIHPYFIGERGNIIRREFKPDKDGNVTEEHIPVTECGHLMVTGVVQDEEGKIYTGKIVNGAWERAFELPAYIWANRTKFAERIKGIAGEKLICQSRNIEHMAMASEYLCTDKEIRVATDFGWNKDFTEFYAVDCVIAADGIHAPTNQFFKCQHESAKKLKLAIPKSDQQLKDILTHIKTDLMHFNNYDIMQYIIGVVFVAPFASLFRKRASTTNAVPSIILHGTTGTGKTGMLILAASFFGKVRDSDLISLSSTPRVVNDLGHWFKDALYIIDDLKWSSIHPAAQTQIIQIMQAYVDGHGRNRLTNTGSGGEWEPSQGKEIRGTVCISAEDLPTGEASVFGRYMIVHLDTHTIDTGLYERCLAESKNYNAVMAAFIAEYLSAPDCHDQLLSNFDKYRRKIEEGVPRERINTVRVCSQLALNLVGYEMFLAFCMRKGVLGRKEGKSLLTAHESRLMTLRDQRLSQITGETPVEKFLAMIASLLSSGRARLDSDISSGKDSIPVIGFEEKDDALQKNILYLNPQASFGMVQRAYDDTRERIPFNQHSLGQQLHSQGYLARKDPEHMTITKRHEGRRSRYYAIDLTKFDLKADEDSFAWHSDGEASLDKESREATVVPAQAAQNATSLTNESIWGPGTDDTEAPVPPAEVKPEEPKEAEKVAPVSIGAAPEVQKEPDNDELF
jgi:hypothetical protein